MSSARPSAARPTPAPDGAAAPSSGPAGPGRSAVVLLDAALGDALPPGALPVLRTAAEVYATPDVPAALRSALGVAAAPAAPGLADRPGVVLLTRSLDDPAVTALREQGADLLEVEPPGHRLLAAVEVMDRLRSPGGCPWDAEQTHDTLRQYLVEETYELLEAIEDGDRAALREELGDVLLQVLFHARIAAEHPDTAFGIDEVAGDLVDKLVGRHPHVFADDPAVRDAHTQQHRWEELKQLEKRRESTMDGVPLAQPAAALAAKLVQRTRRAGFPAELLPGDAAELRPPRPPSTDTTADATDAEESAAIGEWLFGAVAAAKLAGADPEGALRAAARRFAGTVRTAEAAARAERVDLTTADAASWHRYWPARDRAPLGEHHDDRHPVITD